MPRAERILQLTDMLRGRETTTVKDLATELGVSRRTLLRDLACLRDRGMPIDGQAGPGGGVRLDGDRGQAAVHLSITEVVALWLGARLSRCASDLPWSEDANSGMSKLLGGLPTKKARALRALCRRVIVGQPASAHIRAGAAAAPRELLSLFEAAFSNGVGLGFVYSDREGRQSQRRVEPHGLLVEPPVWYVLSRDVDKEEPRTFRMDRIARPRILADILFRPDITVIQAQLPDQDRWRPLIGRWAD
jgi:predicted DNA-binding transcriptional regulator YafY